MLSRLVSICKLTGPGPCETAMYVCLCNALKCHQFKAAAKSGARDVPSAFKACGAKPRCGRCFEEAARMITGAPARDPLSVPAE